MTHAPEGEVVIKSNVFQHIDTMQYMEDRQSTRNRDIRTICDTIIRRMYGGGTAPSEEIINLLEHSILESHAVKYRRFSDYYDQFDEYSNTIVYILRRDVSITFKEDFAGFIGLHNVTITIPSGFNNSESVDWRKLNDYDKKRII